MLKLTFQMPPGEEVSGYTILISSVSGRWFFKSIGWFEYLANPEVTRVAANSSIVRSV